MKRYVVEPKTKEAQKIFEEDQFGRELEIIDQFDPMVQLTKKVEKLGAVLKELKTNPGSWHIFNYFLRGRGIAQQDIDSVMGGVEEFFESAGIDLEEL